LGSKTFSKGGCKTRRDPARGGNKDLAHYRGKKICQARKGKKNFTARGDAWGKKKAARQNFVNWWGQEGWETWEKEKQRESGNEQNELVITHIGNKG